MTIQARFGFALEYVTNIEAATRFYVDVLGLKVQRQHPVFVQFENFALASDESIGGGTETELYWLVDDAQAAFDSVAAKAEVAVPLRDLPFGKVFAIKDPEGHPQYFVQLAQHRPSEAVG